MPSLVRSSKSIAIHSRDILSRRLFSHRRSNSGESNLITAFFKSGAIVVNTGNKAGWSSVMPVGSSFSNTSPCNKGVLCARKDREREAESGAFLLRKSERERACVTERREDAEVYLREDLSLQQSQRMRHLIIRLRAREDILRNNYHQMEDEVIRRQAARKIEIGAEERAIERSEEALKRMNTDPPPLQPRDGWGEVLRFPDPACRKERIPGVPCRCGKAHNVASPFDRLLYFLRSTRESLEICMHLITCPEVSSMLS